MSHDIDSKLVRKLATLLEETGLGELEYATDDWRIRVARPAVQQATSVLAAPAPAASIAPSEIEPADLAGAMNSPMVGTAYLSPDPDSPPFVTVGAKVTEGQTIMIIEAMKVMNKIQAPRAGTVTSVLVQNGQPIEFGQPLIVIE